MDETRRLTPDWALEVATVLTEAAGASRTDARTVAEHLIAADLRGIDTHGLVRLPVYLARAARGELHADAVPEVVRDAPAGALVDGHDGFGQVVATHAMRIAVHKATTVGVGAVAVRNSSHFGAAAAYTMMAAENGCIGLALTNTQPLLPAVGGAGRVVGNNPLSVACPSRLDFPLVLDIAMSQVAAGKLRMAAAAGQPIPDTWAFDPEGNPTTDPTTALFAGGLLRPVADHKGFGLALMIDVLTGALSDGGVAAAVVGLDGSGSANVSHQLLAIHIDTFLGMEPFLDRIDQLIATVRTSPRRQGIDRLYLPGELEHEAQLERRTHGLHYDDRLIDRLQAAATGLGVELPPVV
ncbi:MAG: Ldh family oxidoreductase [Trueperaceae bacterium]